MSEDMPIPVGVIGAGNMGSNHVRVYDELPGATLTEVVEPDPERAAIVREKCDVEILDSPEEIERARAVTVSTPNEYHRQVAETCLRAGLDVLVEKPLAMSVEEAAEIVAIAKEEDAILQVGHIERFNPAIQTLQELLARQEVIALEAHRLGPFNEHLTEESVVFDLMIHDLDVINSLGESSIGRLHALGSTTRSSNIDHAIVQFKFENGVLGATTASHVTNGKIRTLNVTTREAYIMVNYQEQDLVIQRRGTERTTMVDDQSGYRTETITETPFIQNREPLKNELEHFLRSIRTREDPIVSGEDGLEAVEISVEILDKIRS